jgi:uncharacterized UPF0160 family protein
LIEHELTPRHFGKEIIAQRLGWPTEDPKVQLLYDRIYQVPFPAILSILFADGEKFIEGIDANDNGISAYPQDFTPKFEPALSITGMVAGLNPSWNEDPTDDERDARFEKASVLMGGQFLQKLDYYGKSWLPARDIVIKGLEESKALDKQGRILHLPQFCPWKVATHPFTLPRVLEMSIDGVV